MSRNRPHREMRAAGWVARHPGSVLVPGAIGAGIAEIGAIATGSIAAGVVAAGVAWMRAHPESFTRYAAPRLRASRRRWGRYAGRRWANIMLACDLTREHRQTGETLVPRVLRVTSPAPSIDRVVVQVLRGQSPRTFQDRAEELATALNADAIAITKDKPSRLAITVVRGNPFARTVAPAAIPDDVDEVDLKALELGDTEYREAWTEPIEAQHWLVSGATRSGKSGLIWNPLRSMGPMIRDGLVRIWMVDPKGGMETDAGRPLFYRWADHVDDTDEDDGEGDSPAFRGESAVDVIAAFRDAMKATQLGLAQEGKRKFVLSAEMPLNILMIDELAMITAMGSRGAVRSMIGWLGEVLTQGAAAGFAVIGYVQEPTKDVVPLRDLFTRRISFRTTSASYVDMVLGEGARDRGALADQIPADEEYAGIGFRTDDVSRNPIRVRAGHTRDEDIEELVRMCSPDEVSADVVVPIRKGVA